MKKLLFLIPLIFTATILSGTHMSGGEITYEYTGNAAFPNRYEITLTLIRDSRSSATFLNPAITVTNSCGFPSSSFPLTLEAGSGIGITTWAGQNNLPSPYQCVDTSGLDPDLYEIHVFKGTVNLPGQCQDWRFSYRLCCMSGAIANIQNPASLYFYIEASLNNSQYNNNSPKFIDTPLKAFCINPPSVLKWGQRAQDPDNDSIHYQFMNAKSGYNTPVLYAQGYDQNNQISSNPPATIDPKTGIISLKPTNIEYVLVSVSYEDYKWDSINQTYYRAGSIERYMQIPVVPACGTQFSFSIIANPDSAANHISVNCGEDNFRIYSDSYLDPASVAADGSDFALFHNNTLIPLNGASVTAPNSKTIDIQLRDTVSFNDTLYLQVLLGNDLNTIYGECGNPMQAGDSLMIIFQGCSGLGLEVKLNNFSSIYPNPTADILNISFNDYYKDVDLQLRDNTGKLILQKSMDVQVNKFEFDISSLPKGLYHLQLKLPESIEHHSLIKN